MGNAEERFQRNCRAIGVSWYEAPAKNSWALPSIASMPYENLLKESFLGPWLPVPGSKSRQQLHYISIAHWHESAKFMPARPDLRDAVLHCPSAKEARKFAKARQQHWRGDWALVRHAVLVAGLAFMALDRPDLELLEVETTLLVHQLGELKLTESFLELCVARFKEWGQGPRISTFGAATAPEHVIGKKLSKVVQNKPTWTLVSLCNKQAAWNIHDWALAQHVPVQYVGKPKLGTSASVMSELVDASNQLVVFEVKGGKKADVIIQKARAKKVSVTLELFSPQELSAAQLV